MLRVGLTGGLGSGKSTVGNFLRELGAQVIEADEMGRALMEPGQPVFAEIVRVFGPKVVATDGTLDRARVAEFAFGGGRLQELNAIVHPAVIEQQHQWMKEVFARDPDAIAVVISALIFEVERDARARGETDGLLADWRRRIDRVLLVTASDELKISRYVDRLGLPSDRRAAAEADARSRLAHQIPDAIKRTHADYLLENHGDKQALRAQVEGLWRWLVAENNKLSQRGSLE
jgi:dephospho-CoA kinase